MSNKSSVRANALGKARAEALRTCSELLQLIKADLPAETENGVMAVFNGGGKVGFEVLVDAKGQTYVTLVAVEAEGMSRSVAAVKSHAVDASGVTRP